MKGISDKGLTSKIHKEVIELNIKKEDIQMINKIHERCSVSLIIRKMQIKTTMRYYLTAVRVAIIKKTTNSKCW